jgi:ABC-type sugar transport system permease subunit
MDAHRSSGHWNTATGYAFIAPFVILVLVFNFYVFLSGFITSLSDSQGINPGRFIGLQNFFDLLWADASARQDFWQAVGTTLLYMLGCLLTQIPAAFLLAHLLNRMPYARLKVLLRAAFFAPVLINTVVIALLFRMLFNSENGIINWLLGMIGLPDTIDWLMDSAYAIPLLVIVSFWQWTGFHMVYFLSQLQTIDPSIYEAAKIDGASPLTVIWRITLPIMRPAITFVVITSTIGCIQMFDLVFILFPNAQYGPGGVAKTLIALIYDQGFSQQFRIGLASAIGWLTFLLIIGLSLVQLKFLGIGHHDEV